MRARERPWRGLVHRLWEGRTRGEPVSSERGGVAATPVLDDIPGPGAPQGAHGGPLQELQERAEKSEGRRGARAQAPESSGRAPELRWSPCNFQLVGCGTSSPSMIRNSYPGSPCWEAWTSGDLEGLSRVSMSVVPVGKTWEASPTPPASPSVPPTPACHGAQEQ